jgi:hypothetical protein
MCAFPDSTGTSVLDKSENASAQPLLALYVSTEFNLRAL